MARDLIPPASPAGRPLPDGTPNLVELPPDPPPATAPGPVASAPEPSEYRNRFGFLLGALVGVFIAAALVLVVVLVNGRGGSDDPGLASNWSTWKPDDTSVEGGAAEIAKHVGAEYKHPNGQQLVLVTGDRLPVDVAVQPASGPISVFDDTGVVYQLNGLGPNGSIKGGTPSEKRLQLIHREALELALYTFRYLPDVEMVVTLLPPPPPSETDQAAAAASAAGVATQQAAATPQTALFYRPGDLKPQLQVPLTRTLDANTPNPDTIGGPELQTIQALTQSNVFQWSADQAMLVLTR